MDIAPKRSGTLVKSMVLVVIALGALLLRLYYTHTAVVERPVVGDAIQYYVYAWNLSHHQVFSSARPAAGIVAPDSFRDPGYPVFLALVSGGGNMQGGFIERVLDAQAVLSAITVWLFALLARRWIGFGAACAVGVLLALWPHGVTLAGYMLSETLTGFLVALALLLTDNVLRHRGTWRALIAGLAFALAALTNAVLTPFAPLVAAWLAWRDRTHRRTWVIFFLAATLPLAAWSLRGALLPAGQESSSDRAKINFVQGAWPEYHQAARASFAGDPRARGTIAAIDAEVGAIQQDTFGGLARIGERLGSAPGHYLGWYLSKPLELWGWTIGIGTGDIYVFSVVRSPFAVQPVLRGMTDLLFFLSPFVMLFALLGLALGCLRAMRASSGLKVAAALACWITLVYGVLQSDARYAVPFRGIELMLAAFALRQGWTLWQTHRKATFANGRITS